MNKYYINTFTIKILSEDKPLYDLNLEDMNYEVTEGHHVLHSMDCKAKNVSGKKMADLLYDCGSDPGFFQLNDKGEVDENS